MGQTSEGRYRRECSRQHSQYGSMKRAESRWHRLWTRSRFAFLMAACRHWPWNHGRATWRERERMRTSIGVGRSRRRVPQPVRPRKLQAQRCFPCLPSAPHLTIYTTSATLDGNRASDSISHSTSRMNGTPPLERFGDPCRDEQGCILRKRGSVGRREIPGNCLL